MMTSVSLLGVGGILACFAALEFLRARTAKAWPSVIARVVEMPPQSWLERSVGGHSTFNIDSDHFLVWTVDGKDYRKRVDDRAAIMVAGFKLWRRPPVLEETIVRYDPRNPDKMLTPEQFGAWRWLVALSAVFFVIAACVHTF